MWLLLFVFLVILVDLKSIFNSSSFAFDVFCCTIRKKKKNIRRMLPAVRKKRKHWIISAVEQNPECYLSPPPPPQLLPPPLPPLQTSTTNNSTNHHDEQQDVNNNNEYPNYGWTELMEAAQRVDYEMCRYLIEEQLVDVNCCATDAIGYRHNALFALLDNSYLGDPSNVIAIFLLFLNNGINLYHEKSHGITFLAHLNVILQEYYNNIIFDRQTLIMLKMRSLICERLSIVEEQNNVVV